MDSHQLIDTQFDRAVAIVQSLPKTGPIQTDYEEKLAMYSLYKQATVGNVKSPRPGIWDMLGRAKWDAWAKHKDLDSYQAKWLYVDALLKVLRKYSDKTMARDLALELESYGVDTSNLTSNLSHSRSTGSESSGSSVSEEHLPSQYQQPQQRLPLSQVQSRQPMQAAGTTSDEESEDDAQHLTPQHVEPAMSQANRPQSSLSSHRYRTPMAGSLAMSPPIRGIPETQPLPGFETPSAFAEPSPLSAPSSIYPTSSSYVGQFSEFSREGFASLSNLHPSHPQYRAQTHSVPGRVYGPMLPTTRPALEVAIENVQVHLAALTERLESLESLSLQPTRSHMSVSPRGPLTPAWGSGRRSPADRREYPEWDFHDLGMWSLVLNPISRAIVHLRRLTNFFAHNENRSPILIIVRRLCLDVSFLLSLLAVVRILWRKSGVRRREVRAALLALWSAILGAKRERILVDRGV